MYYEFEEGVSMKRWLLLSLVLVVVLVSFFVIRGRVTSSKPLANRSHLARIPLSAYKYALCTEAFAFAKATADNPYKTDFTFHALVSLLVFPCILPPLCAKK
jgi:cytochrome c biogenesis protein CcdA